MHFKIDKIINVIKTFIKKKNMRSYLLKLYTHNYIRNKRLIQGSRIVFQTLR